jgi:hypothetical protein
VFFEWLQLMLACPRCAVGVAARRAFWQQAPLEHLLGAMLPFIVVVAASVAAAYAGRGGDAPERLR